MKTLIPPFVVRRMVAIDPAQPSVSVMAWVSGYYDSVDHSWEPQRVHMFPEQAIRHAALVNAQSGRWTA